MPVTVVVKLEAIGVKAEAKGHATVTEEFHGGSQKQGGCDCVGEEEPADM